MFTFGALIWHADSRTHVEVGILKWNKKEQRLYLTVGPEIAGMSLVNGCVCTR